MHSNTVPFKQKLMKLSIQQFSKFQTIDKISYLYNLPWTPYTIYPFNKH